jgi:hypothetical protein
MGGCFTGRVELVLLLKRDVRLFSDCNTTVRAVVRNFCVAMEEELRTQLTEILNDKGRLFLQLLNAPSSHISKRACILHAESISAGAAAVCTAYERTFSVTGAVLPRG